MTTGIHPYRLIVKTDSGLNALAAMKRPIVHWPRRRKRGVDHLRLTLGKAVILNTRLSRLGFRLGQDYEFKRDGEADGQLLIWDANTDCRLGLVPP